MALLPQQGGRATPATFVLLGVLVIAMVALLRFWGAMGATSSRSLGGLNAL